MESEHAAWLAERKEIVGASEVAAVLGVNPYSSAFEVWARKIGALDDDVGTREAVDWGNRLEPVVAAAYAERTGRALIDHGRHHLIRHPVWPLGCTLDRQIDVRPPEVLEIKTGGQFQAEYWEGERAPLQYVVQVQAQLAVTGYHRGVLACLLGGQRLVVRQVERDEALIVEIGEAVCEFWDWVKSRIPPPVDGSAATRRALKALHPRDSGATIDLGDEIAEVVEQWEAARVDEKAAGARKEAAEAQLFAALGDATWGRLPEGGRIQWRVEPRREHVVAASEPRVLRRLRK